DRPADRRRDRLDGLPGGRARSRRIAFLRSSLDLHTPTVPPGPGEKQPPAAPRGIGARRAGGRAGGGDPAQVDSGERFDWARRLTIVAASMARRTWAWWGGGGEAGGWA